jgi:hypothetical protein
MALTLPDDLSAALGELSEALEKPAATIATELLVEMIPQLIGIAKVARATKAGNKAAAKQAMRHMMGDAMAEIITAQQPELFPAKRGRK